MPLVHPVALNKQDHESYHPCTTYMQFSTQHGLWCTKGIQHQNIPLVHQTSTIYLWCTKRAGGAPHGHNNQAPPSIPPEHHMTCIEAPNMACAPKDTFGAPNMLLVLEGRGDRERVCLPVDL